MAIRNFGNHFPCTVSEDHKEMARMSLEVVPIDVLAVNPWAPELVDRGDGMQEPGVAAATILLRRLPSP
jgi:hypothetical protein